MSSANVNVLSILISFITHSCRPVFCAGKPHHGSHATRAMMADITMHASLPPKTQPDRIHTMTNDSDLRISLTLSYLHDLVHLDPDDVGRHEDEVHDQQDRNEQHVPQLVPQVRVVEEERRVRGKFCLEIKQREIKTSRNSVYHMGDCSGMEGLIEGFIVFEWNGGSMNSLNER